MNETDQTVRPAVLPLTGRAPGTGILTVWQRVCCGARLEHARMPGSPGFFWGDVLKGARGYDVVEGGCIFGVRRTNPGQAVLPR